MSFEIAVYGVTTKHGLVEEVNGEVLYGVIDIFDKIAAFDAYNRTKKSVEFLYFKVSDHVVTTAQAGDFVSVVLYNIKEGHIKRGDSLLNESFESLSERSTRR